MPVITIKNTGALNLQKDQIQANELVTAKNMYFDADFLLTTRRGYKEFGAPIPDGVLLLNSCNATANFVASSDATGLVLDAVTQRRGTGAVQFDITVATDPSNLALVTNAVIGGLDITLRKGYIGQWLYVPVGALANLTTIKVRLGSNSANYYEWDLDLNLLTENVYNFLKLDFSVATTVGVPVDTAINYYQLRISYLPAYTNKLGWRIDDIEAYSPNSTKAPSSLFFHKRDDTITSIALLRRVAILFAGTNAFEFDEPSDSWNIFDSGLTETEVINGETVLTRWAAVVYRNIFYLSNGIDNYRAYNGVSVTQFPATPKARVLRYGIDIVLGGGEDLNPLTLYYTNAAAANANSFPNLVVVGGDEEGTRINTLDDISVSSGTVFLAGLSNMIAVADVVGNSIDKVNTQNGSYSDRVHTDIGNANIYLSENGLETLQQKRGAAGAVQAIESKPITDKIQPLVGQITVRQRNFNCGFYGKEEHNFFFSFDTNDDGQPDRTVVLSTLVPGNRWTEFNWPGAYQFAKYEDSTGELSYLLAPAAGGQIFSMEDGFDDDEIEIEYEVRSGDIDPIHPRDRDYAQFKVYDFIDIVGYLAQDGEIDVEIGLGENVVATATIGNANMDFSVSSKITIGVKPIGMFPIGGGGSPGDSIDLYPFVFRVPLIGKMNATFFYKLTSTSQFKLRSIIVNADGQPYGLFPKKQLAVTT